MILCLVTDRRRLGLAVGARPEAWSGLLLEQVTAAIHAGVDMVQVREGEMDARELTELVRLLVRSAAGTATKVLVNDRVDIALASGASGVHLKETGFLPHAVRRMTREGVLIGCSVHSVSAAIARKAADFLIAGTVLPTASKPEVDYLDQVGLQRIVAAAAGQPVLGIGGLDVPSIPVLAASGAAGMAALGAFIPKHGEPISEFVQKRVAELRLALETSSSGA